MKRNTIILDGDAIWLILNNNKRTVIDATDYDLIKDYHWGADKHGDTYRVRCTNSLNRLSLTRLLLSPKEGLQVDHINGNFLDNRRCNLRYATPQQNSCNHRKYKSNTSGSTGIYLFETEPKYVACLIYQGVKVLNTRFNTLTEAINARKTAEIKYFGEFRRAS